MALETIRWSELPGLAELEADVTAALEIIHTSAKQSAQIGSSYDSGLWEVVTISGMQEALFMPFSYGQSIEIPNCGYYYIVDENDTVTLPGDQFNNTDDINDLVDPLTDHYDVSPGTEPYVMARPYKHSSSGAVEVMMRKTPATSAPGSVSFSLMHYQPNSYAATNIYRVIAAILIEKGLDTSFVDTDAFDRADTEWQDYFGTSGVGPTVYYYRTFNELVSQTIKDLQLHTWDLLFVDINGSLSVGSGTNPYTVTLNTDNVIGSISSESGYDFICNSVDFRWDRPVYMRANKSLAAPTMPDSDDNLKEVPNTDDGEYGYNYVAHPDPEGAKLLDNSTPSSAFEWGLDSSGLLGNLGSVGKYGRRGLHHNDAYEISGESETKKLESLRLRSIRKKSFIADYAARTVYENRPKQRVIMTQDMMGMDFDIGYMAEDFNAGTGAIDDLRCIERTTDFNNLTVESVWLESFLPTT